MTEITTVVVTIPGAATTHEVQVPGIPGADGLSVVDANIDGSGHLILTMSDTTEIDAGVAKGDPGIYVGSTPPPSPNENDLWLDTSP